MDRKHFFILFCLLFACFNLLNTATAGASSKKKFTVVLDAGHGGNDSGAPGKRGKEKDINLSVTLKLGGLIEKNCPDTKVIYTRTKDVFIPLHRRAEIANNAKANLFISIHTNSVASRTSEVYGTETYTLGLHRTKDNLEVAKKENSVILIEDDYKQRYAGFNPNSAESYIIFEFMQDNNMAQSVEFAKLIQNRFRLSNRRDKGVHQAGFLVLRQTSMPSVLIELGYITNPNEESFLLSQRGSTTMAESIYKAFLEYKKGVLTGKETKTEEYNRESTSQNKTAKRDIDPNHPVFKIQILTSTKILPSNSREFKGLNPVNYYKERGLVKYTYGADTDYNKILRMKRNLVDKKFKDAFIIAFKDGKKMNINTAISEFKNKK